MPDLNKKNWLHKKNWGVALLCSTLAFSSAIAEENIAISSLDEVSVDTIGTLVLGGGGLNARDQHGLG